MDVDVAALAAASANTLVTAMTTDAWSGVRNFFEGKKTVRGQKALDELEVSRQAVLESQDTSELLQPRESVKMLLVELVARGELSVEDLVALIGHDASGQQAIFNAEGRDQSRIYQQGSGTQINNG